MKILPNSITISIKLSSTTQPIFYTSVNIPNKNKKNLKTVAKTKRNFNFVG